MNRFLFKKDYVYHFAEPIPLVTKELKSIVEKPFSSGFNIMGQVKNDLTFKLIPKLTLTISVFNIEKEFALLEGKISPDGEHTFIKVHSRANYYILFIFYVMLFVLIGSNIPLNKEKLIENEMMTICLIFILCSLYILIIYSRNNLIKRFHHIMLKLGAKRINDAYLTGHSPQNI